MSINKDTGGREGLIRRLRGKKDGGGKSRTRRKTWFEVHVPDKDGNKPQASGATHHGVVVIVGSVAQGRAAYAQAMKTLAARRGS